MAEGEEGASEHASLRDHADNPFVSLVVVSLFVLAFAAIVRAVGNKLNAPGITAFGGG